MPRSIRKIGDINPTADHQAVMASIEAELWDIGQDLEAIAVDYMNRKNMNVDGTLRDSIKALVINIIKGLRLEFGANTKYAVYVHEGTKPHWPPHKPLRQWVRKKLNPATDELDSIAFLIRRKIAQEGTKAKPFLAVAIRALRDEIPGRIEAAIARAV